MKPSTRDRDRLRGVHPALVLVVEGAFDRFPFAFQEAPSFRLFVIEGLRTMERQREYLRTGASRTLKSRHLTGHAVDLGIQADGAMRWEFDLYRKLWIDCVEPVAKAADVAVEWGGVIFGPRFLDGPHFQLSWEAYPATAAPATPA